MQFGIMQQVKWRITRRPTSSICHRLCWSTAATIRPAVAWRPARRARRWSTWRSWSTLSFTNITTPASTITAAAAPIRNSTGRRRWRCRSRITRNASASDATTWGPGGRPWFTESTWQCNNYIILLKWVFRWNQKYSIRTVVPQKWIFYSWIKFRRMDFF